MKIELLNNAGVQNLRLQLEDQMVKCKSFNIATAFITEDAIQILEIFINVNKNKAKQGRLIISLFGNFNSTAVIKKLMVLQKRSRGCLLISISLNEHFHWKYYFFQTQNSIYSYIGSANFTKPGLEKTGELIAKITLNKGDTAGVEEQLSFFNREWEHSRSIEEFPIENYKQAINKTANTSKQHPSIRDFLKLQKATEVEINPTIVLRIRSFLSQKTVNQISATYSYWDKNGWDYTTALNGSAFVKYKVASHMIIILKENKRFKISLNQIMAHAKIKTDEGNYFIAFKGIGRPRLLSIKNEETLKSLGVNFRANSFIDKKLSKNKAIILKQVFS